MRPPTPPRCSRTNLDTTRTSWIRDLSGKVLREYTRTGAGTFLWSKDYVYRGVQRIATVTSSGTCYLHTRPPGVYTPRHRHASHTPDRHRCIV